MAMIIWRSSTCHIPFQRRPRNLLWTYIQSPIHVIVPLLRSQGNQEEVSRVAAALHSFAFLGGCLYHAAQSLCKNSWFKGNANFMGGSHAEKLEMLLRGHWGLKTYFDQWKRSFIVHEWPWRIGCDEWHHKGCSMSSTTQAFLNSAHLDIDRKYYIGLLDVVMSCHSGLQKTPSTITYIGNVRSLYNI